MSAPLDLQSELFSATGGAAAESVSNQLGRPRADRFTLLVREGVQNSWDARAQDAGGVRFRIEGYELHQGARVDLAAQMFVDTPAALDIRTRLLADSPFPVLAVSDFGTRGLSGPTRGDAVPKAGESTNFVDFMRYIGRPPNRAHAGGTFGFGKAAYYLASSFKTICVHTRFSVDEAMESRFMVAALGPQFETSGASGRRFTGRHWWGRMAQDHVVDPILGEEADALAQMLGGSQRAPHETGTTVYILAPDFQEEKPEAVLANMGRTLMDYFWPKLVDGADRTASMSFEIRWQGSEIPMPQPGNEPELALLTQAFLAASDRQSTTAANIRAISSQRPKALLGHVALVRRPVAAAATLHDGEPDELDLATPKRSLQRPLHHIAVMRAPNFVVKYLEGPPVPYEVAEYAGVFIVDREVDAAFARSEPPTHDDWIPDLLLDPTERTYVRVAQRRLKEVVEAFAAPHPIEATASGPQSVAGFSRLLGGLVPSLLAGRRNLPNPLPSLGKKPRDVDVSRRTADPSDVIFMGDPTNELVDGAIAMVARFEVSGTAGTFVRIVALPKVVVADGFESDPPEGAQQPRVLKWFQPNGNAVSPGAQSCLVPAGSGVWTIAVSIPPDAMISLSLKAETKAEA
jgi:hypothetical protein